MDGELEGLRTVQQLFGREAASVGVVDAAIAAYEDGGDPAAIASELRHVYGQETARDFAQYWAESEAEPMTAADWMVDEQQRAFEAAQNAAAARAAVAAREQQAQHDAIRGAVEAFRGTVPDFDAHLPRIEKLMDVRGPLADGATAEQVIRTAYQGAKEVGRAEQRARLMAENEASLFRKIDESQDPYASAPSGSVDERRAAWVEGRTRELLSTDAARFIDTERIAPKSDETRSAEANAPLVAKVEEQRSHERGLTEAIRNGTTASQLRKHGVSGDLTPAETTAEKSERFIDMSRDAVERARDEQL